MTACLPLPTTLPFLSHIGKVFFWQETEKRLPNSKSLCPVGLYNIKHKFGRIGDKSHSILDKDFPWLREVGKLDGKLVLRHCVSLERREQSVYLSFLSWTKLCVWDSQNENERSESTVISLLPYPVELQEGNKTQKNK